LTVLPTRLRGKSTTCVTKKLQTKVESAKSG